MKRALAVLSHLPARGWLQAMKVYERLRKQGLNPNSTTYNALITVYGKACDLNAVRLEPWRFLDTHGARLDMPLHDHSQVWVCPWITVHVFMFSACFASKGANRLARSGAALPQHASVLSSGPQRQE